MTHIIPRCMREQISLRNPCERNLGITARICLDGVAEDSYEENRYKLQKSISKSGQRVDFRLPLGYTGIENCNKLQKSFTRRLDDGDSQRFLFE